MSTAGWGKRSSSARNSSELTGEKGDEGEDDHHRRQKTPTGAGEACHPKRQAQEAEQDQKIHRLHHEAEDF